MLVSNLVFVMAIGAVPLATASAIGFTSPLLVTALSVPLLHEQVGWRRWSAVVVGFAGALLVIRPGSGFHDPAVLLLLFSSFAYALYQIATRLVGRTDNAATGIVFAALLGSLGMSLAMPFVFVMPHSALDWLLFGSLGLLGGFRALSGDPRVPARAGGRDRAAGLRGIGGDRCAWLSGVRQFPRSVDLDRSRRDYRFRHLHCIPRAKEERGAMTVARQLADFLAGVSVADLPAQAIDNAAMLIASTIASAAAGRGLASARIIRELARERGGRPEASLWFDAGERVPIADAAQANAVMSDAAASDDSDLRNIVHAGTPLTAVSLAIAERNGASGEEVLAAIVCGYEAAGRISEAITPGFRTRGFHGCHGAVFAASVAAARILRLDAARMAPAIALAATSIGGLATAADTSVAREYHAGLAAMLGVNAALAAQRGYQCEESVLETPLGFFEAFGGIDGAAGAAIATAGPRRKLGHLHRHGDQADARRPPISRDRRGRRQRGTPGRMSWQRMWRASRSCVPA